MVIGWTGALEGRSSGPASASIDVNPMMEARE